MRPGHPSRGSGNGMTLTLTLASPFGQPAWPSSSPGQIIHAVAAVLGAPRHLFRLQNATVTLCKTLQVSLRSIWFQFKAMPHIHALPKYYMSKKHSPDSRPIKIQQYFRECMDTHPSSEGK